MIICTSHLLLDKERTLLCALVISEAIRQNCSKSESAETLQMRLNIKKFCIINLTFSAPGLFKDIFHEPKVQQPLIKIELILAMKSAMMVQQSIKKFRPWNYHYLFRCGNFHISHFQIPHKTWNFWNEEINVAHEMKDVKGAPDGFEPGTTWSVAQHSPLDYRPQLANRRKIFGIYALCSY